MMMFVSRLRRFVIAAGSLAVAVGALAPMAQARVFVGIGVPLFAPPFYAPPPPMYYAPPPVYYAPPPPVYYAPPPPVYYTPPQGVPMVGGGPGGGSCQAPPYACPMDRPSAPGASCYCVGNNGSRIWGRVN